MSISKVVVEMHSSTVWAVLALGLSLATSMVEATGVKARATATGDTPPAIAKEWSIGLWKPRGGPGATGFGGITDDDYNDPNGSAGTNPPPYNAEYAALYRRVREAAWAGTNDLDYGSRCLLYGMPSVMDGSVIEFVFEPKRVYVLVEELGGVRRIWLDGRSRPGDMERTYNGFSVGHWEGNTLVVTTTHLRTDSILDIGAPHSDALSIVERISPEDTDGLKDEVTMVDTKALTRPWVGVVHLEHHRDWIMQERVCAENNRTENSGAGAPGTLKGVAK